MKVLDWDPLDWALAWLVVVLLPDLLPGDLWPQHSSCEGKMIVNQVSLFEKCLFSNMTKYSWPDIFMHAKIVFISLTKPYRLKLTRKCQIV